MVKVTDNLPNIDLTDKGEIEFTSEEVLHLFLRWIHESAFWDYPSKDLEGNIYPEQTEHYIDYHREDWRKVIAALLFQGLLENTGRLAGKIGYESVSRVSSEYEGLPVYKLTSKGRDVIYART